MKTVAVWLITSALLLVVVLVLIGVSNRGDEREACEARGGVYGKELFFNYTVNGRTESMLHSKPVYKCQTVDSTE